MSNIGPKFSQLKSTEQQTVTTTNSWTIPHSWERVNHNISLITIAPITVSAHHRRHPQTRMNAGKGLIINWQVYTAWHVISDSEYLYSIGSGIMLTTVNDLGNDIGRAFYTGSLSLHPTQLTLPPHDYVLMWSYRNNQWMWLTGLIITRTANQATIDQSVLPGDSGSPVIFADRTIGIVSQSHESENAIVSIVSGW